MIAVKNLLAEKTRLALSVLGVALGVLLVLVMTGLFVGTTRQVTTYIDHSRNAVWVMQPGVSQMFKAVSWLPADTERRLTALPEVASADPIIGLPSDFVHDGTHTAYFVLGYDTATGVGGPWSLAQGRTVEQPGEVVLDRILAGKNGIRLGDTVELVDEEFTVVGLSNQTAAATNYYTFISLPDAARLLRARDRVSYFLVQPNPGYSHDQLIAAIRSSVPGVDAYSAATFAENSRDIIVTMIGRPLKTMIAIAALVGIALVGLTMWALTAEQLTDFGLLRALGVRSHQLWRTVLAQAGLIAALGYLVGACAAFAAEVLLGDRLGDVTIAITPAMLVAVAAGTAVMAALGSVLPARRVAKIDPAIAFHRWEDIMRCPVCHLDASPPRCGRCRRAVLGEAPNPVLQLIDVTHHYGTGGAAVQALGGITMSVDRGEVVLVVGPSGGGKTTALLVMGLLLTPDSGTVRVGGEDVGTLAERERATLRLMRLGFLFQDYNLLNSLTSVENVAVPLRYAGIRKSAALARATELLDSLGLAHRAGHRPAELSGGEKQRVATARALAMGPEVILADEPTANLDSVTGRKVSEQLAAAAKANGAAVVIVTHDSRLDDIADRVVHLEDGRILERAG